MKVAFCTSPLTSGHAQRGVGSYTLGLLKALKKNSSKSWEITEFEKEVPKNSDLVHYPFFDPFFLTLPINKVKPTVVTVHDLIPLIFPEHFPKGLKGSLKWNIQKYALLQVDRIITDSENSASDITRLISFERLKISVVYLAADREYRKVFNRKELSDTAKKYNLEKNFFLYVGDINWNKNISGLIKSYAVFHKRHPRTAITKLVLVGSAFFEESLPEAVQIRSLVKELMLEEQVLFLGRLLGHELVHLYNLAYCYIQPSFYEGFGLPVLEAMQCGCPVICSNHSSLPEVAGNAALYFDPEEQNDLTEKMEMISTLSKEEYERYVKKSLEQSAKFTWEKTAQETLAAYEKTLKK